MPIGVCGVVGIVMLQVLIVLRAFKIFTVTLFSSPNRKVESMQVASELLTRVCEIVRTGSRLEATSLLPLCWRITFVNVFSVHANN